MMKRTKLGIGCLFAVASTLCTSSGSLWAGAEEYSRLHCGYITHHAFNVAENILAWAYALEAPA